MGLHLVCHMAGLIWLKKWKIITLGGLRVCWRSVVWLEYTILKFAIRHICIILDLWCSRKPTDVLQQGIAARSSTLGISPDVALWFMWLLAECRCLNICDHEYRPHRNCVWTSQHYISRNCYSLLWIVLKVSLHVTTNHQHAFICAFLAGWLYIIRCCVMSGLVHVTRIAPIEKIVYMKNC